MEEKKKPVEDCMGENYKNEILDAIEKALLYFPSDLTRQVVDYVTDHPTVFLHCNHLLCNNRLKVHVAEESLM